jgi:hypothetical protein
MRVTRENTAGTVSSVGEVRSRSAAGPSPLPPTSTAVSIMDPVSGALLDRSRLPRGDRRGRRC